jgi:hypothetical protein
MTRWLLFGCAAVVAAGVAYRLTAGASGGVRDAAPVEQTRAGAESAAASAPRAAQVPGAPAKAAPRPDSPTVREVERRLLADDKLTPPPATATEEEKRAYDRAVRSIAQGQDPLLQHAAAPPPPAPGTAARPVNANGPRPPTTPEELRKRVEERRKTATERVQKLNDARQQQMAERVRQIVESHPSRVDPNQPPPPPLFEPPKLGPAVTGVEGQAPASK